MGWKSTRRRWLQVLGLGGGMLAGRESLSAASSAPGKSIAEPAQPGPTITMQRTLPVRHDVDVFIAGGGPAGIAATLAARRQGARVYLAEGHSCFGGMGTAGRVPVFMTFGDGVNFLADGVGRTVRERLKHECPALRGNAIHAESLKRVYDDLMVESAAAFTFHTHLIGVETDGRRVTHALCTAPAGLFAVKAKVFVDATGNGDLAAWAGAPFEQGDENGQLMPATLCSQWVGIDWKTWLANRPPGPQPEGRMLEQAIADGVLSVPDYHLTGMSRQGEHLAGGNIGHIFGVDATDEESLTRALLQGRKGLTEYERYYKQYLKGFENMSLVATGSLLGVRETRRILGDYVLCVDDFKRRAVFRDEIGRYCFPVDLHPTVPGKQAYEQHRKQFDSELCYKKGESYGIPYRVLTPGGLDNVLTAGRCVSTDRYVHGSLRVMPGCFITGQAAGTAAAIAAAQDISTHKVDVPDLQQRLKDLGAYLPNA